MWKRVSLSAVAIGLGLLAGCQSQTPAAHDPSNGDAHPSAVLDPVVARIGDDSIPMSQLEKPLIEAYGLNVMLGLVELDLARQNAAAQQIPAATPADIDDETTRTILLLRKAAHEQNPSTDPSDDGPMSASEREQLLSSLLSQRHLTRGEFNIAMTSNYYLRKLAAPAVEKALTEELIQQRFNALYGEKAHVKFIRLPDQITATQVLDRIRQGSRFEDEMARRRLESAMSTDPRPSIGEMDFSRQDMGLSPTFKEVAFALKAGEVSPTVQLADSYYLLELDHYIPPQHAKYEDYRDSVRAGLLDNGIQNQMVILRQQLDNQIRQHLVVVEPTLAQQWSDNLTKMNQQLHDADELKQKMAKDQQNQLSKQSATVPSSDGAMQAAPTFNLGAATQPAAAP